MGRSGATQQAAAALPAAPAVLIDTATIKLMQARGLRFDRMHEDPEICPHGAHRFRTNTGCLRNGSIDLPLEGSFTITPKRSEQVAIRIFDSEDWGQPLGLPCYH